MQGMERKGPPIVLWLVIGAVVFSLMFAGGIGALGFWTYNRMQAETPTFPNYGQQQITRRHDDGWMTIYFPDLRMTLDLPAEPEPSEFDWDDESRISVAQYSAYEFESEFVQGWIDAYRYIPIFNETLRDEAKAEAEFFKPSEGYKNAKSQRKSRTIDGRESIRVSTTYNYEENPAASDVLIIKDDNRTIYIRCTYWLKPEHDVSDDAERIFQSVQFGK
jgi:hypothetical protein